MTDLDRLSQNLKAVLERLERENSSLKARGAVAATVRRAIATESQAIFELVNAAYAVELGDKGLAFKKENRYLQESEVSADIRKAEQDPARSAFFCHVLAGQQTLAGVIRLVVRDDDRTAVDFGPFAVNPSCQGRGIGSKLLLVAEEWAQSKGCTSFKIEVVNHRIDLWDDSGQKPAGFYGRAGFEKVGEAPCDAEHNCDESKVTRPSSFVLLARSLS